MNFQLSNNKCHKNTLHSDFSGVDARSFADFQHENIKVTLWKHHKPPAISNALKFIQTLEKN